MKRIFFVIVFLLSECQFANAEMADAYDSVCTIHIELETAYTGGTGFVYKESENEYYVMTAGHVVDESIKDTCRIQFYHQGVLQEAVEATILKKDYNKIDTLTDRSHVRDIAVITVKKNLLKFTPKIIPLAPKDQKMTKGGKVFSLGCPELRWPSAFLGTINRIIEERYYFTPNVIGGRSGSPVYNDECTMVIGVVIWTTEEGGCAISPYGISLHKI